MGFIGLLMANGSVILAFMIWVGMLILGMISMVIFVILVRKYYKNKHKKNWQKVTSIICLLIALFSLGTAGSVAWDFTHPGPATTDIKTKEGKIEVLREDAFTFEHEIKYDDVEAVRGILDDTPAFWEYTNIEGSTIMGIAVANGSVEVAEYLLQSGFDVDYVGVSGKDTAFQLYVRQIEYGKYRPEMFRLLIKYQASTEAAYSLLYDIEKSMCYDGMLTDDEVDLLEELVEAGLSADKENGLGEKAAAALKRVATEKEVDKNCPEQVERGIKILSIANVSMLEEKSYFDSYKVENDVMKIRCVISIKNKINHGKTIGIMADFQS